MSLTGGATIDSSSFISEGGAGNIIIKAQELVVISGYGTFNSSGREEQISSQISSGTAGSGRAGNIKIMTPFLKMKDHAQVAVFTVSDGDAGNIFLDVGNLELTGSARVDASTRGLGKGGNIEVNADRLYLRSGGQIVAVTFGPGQGGNIEITAGQVLLEGGIERFRSGLFVSSEGTGIDSGDAGNLTLSTQSLELRDGGQIVAATFGPGQGGNIEITAGQVLLEGEGDGFRSGLFVSSEGRDIDSGDGGDLTLRTDSLELRAGGTISAATFGPGRGGAVRIEAKTIELSDGSTIAASSFSEDLTELLSEDPDAGKSGRIEIHSDSVRLINGSSITVETAQANAGDILLNVGTLMHLRDDSQVTTSVAGGQGDGGNIFTEAQFIVLDGAKIIANAQEGRGGNINIRIVDDGAFFQSPDSIVDASSALGIDGAVEIDAPDTDISGSLTALPATFLDASALLSERCAARTAEEVSSFVVVGRGGLPRDPEALLSSDYLDEMLAHRAEHPSSRVRGSLASLPTTTPILAMLEQECAR